MKVGHQIYRGVAGRGLGEGGGGGGGIIARAEELFPFLGDRCVTGKSRGIFEGGHRERRTGPAPTPSIHPQ